MPSNSIQAAIAATRAIALPEVCLVEDIAQHLRRSPTAVRALIRSGRLPGLKVGRRWVLTREAVLAALSVQCQVPTGHPHLSLHSPTGDAQTEGGREP